MIIFFSKLYQIFFATSCPIGVVIGIIVFSIKLDLSERIISILTGLSTGTFLYVTFFEILGKVILEGSEKSEDLIGFFCFLFGFGIFAGVTSFSAMQV